MSDFLNNLVARNNNQLETVQPRIPSLFEPGIETRNLSILGDFQQYTGIDDPSVTENIQELPTHRTSSVHEIHQLEAESYPTPVPEKNQMGKEIPRQPNEERIEYITRIQDESPTINSESTQPQSHPPPPPTSSHEKTQMGKGTQRITDGERKGYIFTRDKDESPPSPNVRPQTNVVTNNYLQTVEVLNQQPPEPTVIQQVIAKETFTKEIFTPKESKTVTPKIHPLTTQEPETKIVEQVILPIAQEEVSSNTKKLLITQEISPTQTLITPPPTTPKISIVKESQPIQETTEAAPTINVTIGRIEVRATTPATLSKPAKPKGKPSVMSLDEYLHQRGGGT
ncbi:hypothetical protein [Calothrix rhizosoleniae]|uniref:hypothetical protein n=1 Tax=Calothrix rhizosoleniae TaxID=888997 RepID=UPI000B498721|nr:hypothetical protein [Calothrix rhizosoleniae]